MNYRYQAIVGNIGTVYHGGELKEALTAFGEYRRQSKTGYGRAAGEDVCVMDRGELWKEYSAPCAHDWIKQPDGKTSICWKCGAEKTL